ncbi:hypothetical protein BJ166DRAFT_391666 [Pestalotiopsis sp. NC0098]|nr:hypothetical protein BJ166DRAFT_391666 [Pestalotiopsis sp. NC0098]
MVKAAAAPAPTGPGIYSATYSGIPVYEYQFGQDLKEHVMRRRQDDWINATHILKAAGYDKPARTRILEREVQKDEHEKIQGGYGKYQGTWIPLEAGSQLAQKNNVWERLQPIFEFTPGNQSPPPAPRHASKPKAPRAKPAVPKWAPSAPPQPPPQAQQLVQQQHHEYETASQVNEEDTPDNLTVASASYMAEDDRPDMSHYSTGHRKRKREEHLQDMTEQQHALYGDELLDYFLLSRQDGPAARPEPPPNFQADYFIDTDRNTSLHWASAMGDIEVMRQLKRFGASLSCQNIRGETPLMRAVCFTNSYEKQSFPAVLKELFDTIDARDESGCTVLHHAVTMRTGRVLSHTCSRYYLDNILNRLQEIQDPNYVQIFIDTQDLGGNTALHLAAQSNSRKCIRALLGRGASTDIPNAEGVRAEELIQQLNASKGPKERAPQRSSSPFAPESQRHVSFRDALTESVNKLAVTYHSGAANTVQSKITPLVLEKFQDLARSYDEEWKEKNDAEVEARRILGKTQNELAVVGQDIAGLKARLEPEENAAKAFGDATMAQHQVLDLLAAQTRHLVNTNVQQQLSLLNGNATSSDDSDPETRLQLANQLREALAEQRKIEREHVDALGLSGTGENIDKYRQLLKKCLDRADAENLDANLDDLIEMMEEERSPTEGPGVVPENDRLLTC